MARNDNDDAPYRILFVCTGNTCRSPLAEAIARDELEMRGIPGVEVASAGASALPGMPASDGALWIAERRGLDLTAHRSASLTPQGLEEADLVLVMSAAHLARVRELEPEARVSLLSAFAEGREGQEGAPVPDPFGGGDEEYELAFDSLRDLVARALERLEVPRVR